MLLKLITSNPIFFFKKLNFSSWLYINYNNLNYLTIINPFLLHQINKVSNKSKKTLRFTWLNIINCHYKIKVHEEKAKNNFSN